MIFTLHERTARSCDRERVPWGVTRPAAGSGLRGPPTDGPGRAAVVSACLCADRPHEARREVERVRRNVAKCHAVERASETTPRRRPPDPGDLDLDEDQAAPFAASASSIIFLKTSKLRFMT